MRLSFEKTRGTRTIYFPLERSSDYPADFVVVIEPTCEHGFAGEDHFSAGIAFCNPADHFVKRKGRSIAFERLKSYAPGVCMIGDSYDIYTLIMEKVCDINRRRDLGNFGAIEDVYVPDMDEGQIQADLEKVLSFEALSEYFTKKEENRGEQLALEA